MSRDVSRSGRCDGRTTWAKCRRERAIAVVMARLEAKVRSAPALRTVNAETPPLRVGFLLLQGSLTITYFHTGIRTIIGVESFHGPVRDGKGWDRLAMVIRHDLLPCCSWSSTANLEEVVSGEAHQR